jgi:hypothetical protein
MRLGVRAAGAGVICFALLLLLPVAGSADIEGLYFVEVDPDTADTTWTPVNPPSTAYCKWSRATANDPGYWYWAHQDTDVESDVDLLISNTLQGDVTEDERNTLINTFDFNREDNYFEEDEKDLELIVNYLSMASAYDTTGTEGNFELFPVCADSTIPLLDYRDEVDLYLAAESDSLGSHLGGQADTLQDWPRSSAHWESTAACSEQDGNEYICDEYGFNAVTLSDGGGNAVGGDDDWPLKTASTASHEFGHVIWASNSSMWRGHPIHGNFNELFACAAGLLSNPPVGAQGYDKPYAQSLLYRLAGPLCSYMQPPPDECPDWADYQDCRTGYTNWGLWATYLAGHFHEQDYTDDVLYKWARVQDPPDSGRLRRDMCGLATVFDDAMYSSLGSSGGERLSRVFHDFSVAKWVDSATYDTTGRYLFPEYSPRYDFGLFNKNDLGTGGQYNCWELAVPPVFTVSSESDSVWQHVPGNASDSLATGCTDGWNDPRNTTYCGNSYCDSVKVRLWGSYFIGFLADTTYYTTNDDSYLEIKLDWAESAMNDSTELWVSILKYSDYWEARGDSLFLDGKYLKQVLTDQFAPEDSVVIVVPDFNEGGSEAAAVVMSLVPTVFDPVTIDCSASQTKPMCLPRRGNGYPTRDLAFTYSFTVTEGSGGGGGCPHAEVLTADGYELDNNVLVGGVHGVDVDDYYVLESPPVDENGRYRIRLREDANDLSHFDRVSLQVVDLPEGQELGVVDGRGLVTYRRAGVPLECRDENGASLLGSVADEDGDMIVLPAGSWVDVQLPLGGRAGGGAGAKGGPGHKEDPPLGGRSGRGEGGVLDLTPLCYRGRECTTVLPLPDSVQRDGGVAAFRISTPVDFYLDQLFSVEFIDSPVETEDCRLLAATSSGGGDVSQALSAADGSSVQLGRGETISLEFAAPEEEANLSRSFVLVTHGRYEHLEGRSGDTADDEVPVRLSASAYPNPFAPTTRIRFQMPSPGGDVSIRVFNVAGRLVRDLGQEDLPPGTYEVEWDGRDSTGERAAAGVYFYSIRTLNDAIERKMVLLR